MCGCVLTYAIVKCHCRRGALHSYSSLYAQRVCKCIYCIWHFWQVFTVRKIQISSLCSLKLSPTFALWFHLSESHVAAFFSVRVQSNNNLPDKKKNKKNKTTTTTKNNMKKKWCTINVKLDTIEYAYSVFSVFCFKINSCLKWQKT